MLAVATRELPAAQVEDDALELGLTLIGLVGLHDPLRESAREAVEEARAAGLRVEMMTGDHPRTAEAIGRSLGLSESAIHARVTPAEKLRLVESLQDGREVVAVTGDGVNDAPALRLADVGVAMGRGGTEAARESADLVLTDDDFATIVAAIREGRAIADNIRKFVAFLLSANLGEVALFAVAIFAGLGVPMTVVQVLLVNVLTDGLPAVALTRDPAAADTMRRPPERGDRLFPARAWGALAVVGALVGLAALAAFLVGRTVGGEEARTMAFATVALSELALVFSLRSPIRAAWQAPRNLYLLGSVVLSAAIVLAVLYLPMLNEPLGTVPLRCRPARRGCRARAPPVPVRRDRQGAAAALGVDAGGGAGMRPRLGHPRHSELIRHYLPDLVYGANDGIITTFAVVSGVVGADLSERIIVDSRVRDPPRGRLLRRERKLLALVCSARVAAARRR